MNTILENITKVFTEALFPPKCLKCGKFLITDRADSLMKIKNPEISDIEPGYSRMLNIGSVAPEVSDIKPVDSNVPGIESLTNHFLQYFCSSCFKDAREDQTKRSVYDCQSHSFCIAASASRAISVEIEAASAYHGVVKESIHLLKYSGKTALADPLGALLFQTFARYSDKTPVDFIVPVPLYRLRMIKRGFNQSFLLVRNFRKYWIQSKGTEPAWKIDPEILIRKRNTKSQTGFDRKQRQENIKDAFASGKNRIIRDRHIVLVDDVYTTGATIREAANILLEAGASCVGVVVVAKA
ncbi:MAG: ComF family protein [Desulfamplus sp.]|nr:ComF family protein [Desulfamplus sp.]